MSFKSVKKTVYSTTQDALSAVSTGVSVANKSMKYADNWLERQLQVQEAGAEQAIRNALATQAEEFKQEQRDLVVESNKSKMAFYSAIKEQDEKIQEIMEELSAETLAKYQDLL